MESIIQTFTGTVSWGAEVQITLNRTGDLIFYMYILLDIPAIRAVDGCNSASVGRGLGGMQFPFPRICDPCEDGPLNRCNTRSFEGSGSSFRGGSSSSSSSSSSDSDSMSQGSEDSSESRSGCEDEGCSGPWAHWVDEIGFAALPRVAFSIGGQVIDTLHSHYLHMWEELSGQPGKHLEEMIGKGYTRLQLIHMSQRPRRLYVPLPFYFTRHSGNVLPLVSLQFHSLMVHAHFACLQNLIQVSDPDVLVVKCSDNQPITNADMCAYLDTTYVYLDMEERDRFAVGSFQQLITQVQYFCTTGHQSEQITVQLNFNHPMLELMWAVQRGCQSAANNTFNYSGAWGCDPIERARLLVNNLSRFEREAGYFRMVQPYQHHTNIPRGHIYVYSFCLFPEDCQPSGSLNFSRIDNVEFSVRLQPAIARDNVNLIVVGRNFNVLRFKEGLAGILYSG